MKIVAGSFAGFTINIDTYEKMKEAKPNAPIIIPVTRPFLSG